MDFFFSLQAYPIFISEIWSLVVKKAFIFLWHLHCVPFLQAWRVECICSFPWLIAFSLSYKGSLELACFLQLRWSSQWKTCHVPRHCGLPSPPFHSETRHLCLSTCETSQTPTNRHAWFLWRGLTTIFVSSALPLESERLCAFLQPLVTESFPLWLESMGELCVSGLMDGLSDFIWAGRTLRWLWPRDCHFWLLYQGLTYRAVILLEQGSQAPRPAIPSFCLSQCHPGTLACMASCLTGCLHPTHPGTHSLKKKKTCLDPSAPPLRVVRATLLPSGLDVQVLDIQQIDCECKYKMFPEQFHKMPVPVTSSLSYVLKRHDFQTLSVPWWICLFFCSSHYKAWV